jgi:hypothetical protein
LRSSGILNALEKPFHIAIVYMLHLPFMNFEAQILPKNHIQFNKSCLGFALRHLPAQNRRQ